MSIKNAAILPKVLVLSLVSVSLLFTSHSYTQTYNDTIDAGDSPETAPRNTKQQHRINI